MKITLLMTPRLVMICTVCSVLLIALLVVGAPLALAAAIGLAAGRKVDDPPLTESGRHPAAREGVDIRRDFSMLGDSRSFQPRMPCTVHGSGRLGARTV